MTLTATGLKAVIISELNAELGTPIDSATQQKFADALATAIITYLVTNTVVTVNTTTGIGVIS